MPIIERSIRRFHLVRDLKGKKLTRAIRTMINHSPPLFTLTNLVVSSSRRQPVKSEAILLRLVWTSSSELKLPQARLRLIVAPKAGFVYLLR